MYTGHEKKAGSKKIARDLGPVKKDRITVTGLDNANDFDKWITDKGSTWRVCLQGMII